MNLGTYKAAVQYIASVTCASLAHSGIHGSPLCIANRRAGTRARHRVVVGTAQAMYRMRSGVADDVLGDPTPIIWTDTPEAATELVGRAIRERVDNGATHPVIVSLGGDGTHRSVLQAGAEWLRTYPANSFDARGPRFLRVPLGSGNDSADFETIATLSESPETVFTPHWIPALRITSRSRSWWAFNIASVGIDAFVTAMHDRWRRILPGNTYRVIADLAVLRFERILDLGPMRITLNEAPVPETIYSLVAVGASGNRTYGNHMRVLPGAENVCIIGSAGLREKLRLKALFYAGAHVDEPLTRMATAQRVVIDYRGRLPLQMDGEATWVEADEWPVTIEVVERAVTVFGPARV